MATLSLAELASALPRCSKRSHHLLLQVSGKNNARINALGGSASSSVVVHRKRYRMQVGVGDDDLYSVEDVIDDQIESTLDMLDEGADKTAEELLLGFGLPPPASAAAPVEAGPEAADGATEDRLESVVAAGTVVEYKINEDEFHKISLHECDFFIRKVPDPDDNVYDFREMYVTPPDTDVYSIPKVIGKMPKQNTRCNLGKWNEIVLVRSNDRNNPREAMGRNEFHALKVFLIKHYRNRRMEAPNFVLNFEKVFVLDGATKSIRKAKVKIEVPGGKDRDRSKEILTIRDGGKTFTIIPQEKRKSPDEVIAEFEWKRSREEFEKYLRTFRDFETSNWF
ncbi:uncharacterized protein LOC9649034 isoform X2 [Selaginella moellendorffii]|nr:uncharacterized protein LOC9649034 isoform X2 [Selaginella moellendorffii]|eukprot:XP_002976643.2 uncharacterized protein LOC9649034 isoform X2 [Selaginella moellendorffii]